MILLWRSYEIIAGGVCRRRSRRQASAARGSVSRKFPTTRKNSEKKTQRPQAARRYRSLEALITAREPIVKSGENDLHVLLDVDWIRYEIAKMRGAKTGVIIFNEHRPILNKHPLKASTDIISGARNALGNRGYIG